MLSEAHPELPIKGIFNPVSPLVHFKHPTIFAATAAPVVLSRLINNTSVHPCSKMPLFISYYINPQIQLIFFYMQEVFLIG